MSKKYETKKILVKRRYQLLAAILFLLAAGLVLLPKYKKNEGINPKLFVKNAMSTERYISTDLLAERIINQDPTLLLIDTRTESEFNEYSLPNAINIPLKYLLDEDNLNYIDQDDFDVILFSNDNFFADQAWMIGNRLGFKNLYVLKGGLNEWFSTIIDPKYPDETMSQEEFEIYSFRKGAGRYFGVGVSENENKSPKVRKVIIVQKKKKKVAEGGC